jgi:hypothetical protein
MLYQNRSCLLADCVYVYTGHRHSGAAMRNKSYLGCKGTLQQFLKVERIYTTQLTSGIGARTRRLAVDVQSMSLVMGLAADQQATRSGQLLATTRWRAPRQGRPFPIAADPALTVATRYLQYLLPGLWAAPGPASLQLAKA